MIQFCCRDNTAHLLDRSHGPGSCRHKKLFLEHHRWWPETQEVHQHESSQTWISLYGYTMIHFFSRETTAVTSCSPSCQQSHSGEGIFLMKKEFFPISKFFTFGISFYWQGRQKHIWKSCLTCMCIHSP